MPWKDTHLCLAATCPQAWCCVASVPASPPLDPSAKSRIECYQVDKIDDALLRNKMKRKTHFTDGAIVAPWML